MTRIPYDRLEEFNLRDAVSYYDLIDALCDHQHVAEAVEICFGDRQGGDVSPGANQILLLGMIESSTSGLHAVLQGGWTASSCSINSLSCKKTWNHQS
ncbi:hypothetical protein SAY86_026083 [Trapa natans]|uniref:Uncharacterized protein n=1 Tax=Trapa natans TaxID=22666 RepID=A0AAN7KHX9_TRANT|nr:hypothetical protein SAY86_026083 [Trapa natans]